MLSLSKQSAKGWTALHYDAVNGDIELVRYLVKFGANVNKSTGEGSPEPRLLLAAEPSGPLALAAAARLHSLLSSLARERHQTVVIVTHDDRLAAMADRILRLEEGRLVPVS